MLYILTQSCYEDDDLSSQILDCNENREKLTTQMQTQACKTLSELIPDLDGEELNYTDFYHFMNLASNKNLSCDFIQINSNCSDLYPFENITTYKSNGCISDECYITLNETNIQIQK